MNANLLEMLSMLVGGGTITYMAVSSDAEEFLLDLIAFTASQLGAFISEGMPPPTFLTYTIRTSLK